jgi:hypothetical protein
MPGGMVHNRIFFLLQIDRLRGSISRDSLYAGGEFISIMSLFFMCFADFQNACIITPRPPVHYPKKFHGFSLIGYSLVKGTAKNHP